jgi:hypothetical protein
VRAIPKWWPGVGLLVILSLARSGDAFAQLSPCEIGPTSCERPPSRFFQMALWTYEEHGVNWTSTVGRVDVPMFSEGNAQPPGRSIMQFKSWGTPNVAEYLALYDWSRIVAAVIDEPYWTALRDPNEVNQNQVNPCRQPSDGRLVKINTTRSQIINGAAALRAIAPKTRLWVNYSEPEVNWMKDTGCPLSLNGPYIDVVSIDKYDVSFTHVRPYYDWFISSMPQQQVALVPGTFFRQSGNNPFLASAYLQGYFDYANRMNQSCDIGLGNVGATGNYDGCRVWMVAGWSTVTVTEGAETFVGILDPRSELISDRWQEQLAVPARFGPRPLPKGVLQAIELLRQ